VRLINETGVELPGDGGAVDVGLVGDDDEFGAAGPIGRLVEPVNLASLPDYLEQVPVVRIVGAMHELLDPVDRTGKKPDRREERVDVDGAIAGVGPVLESAGAVLSHVRTLEDVDRAGDDERGQDNRAGRLEHHEQLGPGLDS
jgi:hypothetical protein